MFFLIFFFFLLHQFSIIGEFSLFPFSLLLQFYMFYSFIGVRFLFYMCPFVSCKFMSNMKMHLNFSFYAQFGLCGIGEKEKGISLCFVSLCCFCTGHVFESGLFFEGICRVFIDILEKRKSMKVCFFLFGFLIYLFIYFFKDN